MKLLATGLFLVGLLTGLAAGFIFFAAFSDWSDRGCTSTAQCSDAFGVMVLMGCALVAAAVMIFAAIVFVRR